MAFIKDILAGINGLAVDAQSAARAVLYGATNPLTKARGAALLTGDHCLPMGALADGNIRFARADKTGALASGEIMVLLHEPFEGATVSSPNRITLATTTFVQAQTAAAGLNFNSTNVNTAAAAALLTSNKQFLRASGSPLHFQIRARVAHVANAQIEFGFGAPASQTAAPAIGAFWQITTTGVVQPVWAFNGTDVPGTPVTMPVGWQNNYYQWSILSNEEEFVYYILDPSTNTLISEQRIPIVNTGVKGWNASHLPIFARFHNVTAPATAANLIISRLDVYGYDLNQSFPLAAQLAFSGFDGLTNPLTFANLSNIPSTAGAPANGTLAAATASYTTLGGQFQFLAVAGAETEFPLFAFTVPAPYSFFCTGVEIDLYNSVVAVATTASLFQWSVIADATAAAITTTSHRRIGLGIQSLPIGAAVGAQAQSISRQFPLSDCPLIAGPGRLLIIGLKMPIATATATEIFRGLVNIKGFFY
jgi:hypothetical protein